MSVEHEPDRGDAPAGSGDDCHYDSYYYSHCCGLPYERSEPWLALFRNFADRIAREIEPESMLDAGCAMGFLVESLHERGVDAHGIDISEYAISRVHETIRDRCRVGSVLEPFGRRFDLIVSIEVLEHLQPRDAERAVENFCEHADDVVLSTTPFDYKEASHFNVQPPEYWAELFARRGFYRDLDYDASYITRWAVRFRKAKMPAPRIVAGYERKLWRLLQENLGARESLMEHQAQLIRAEEGLTQARAHTAQLEDAVRQVEARLAERHAAEAANAVEWQRSVDAWSERARAQDEQIVRAADEHRRLSGQLHDRERDLAEAESRVVSEQRTRVALEASLQGAESSLAEMSGQLAGTRGRLEATWAILTQVRGELSEAREQLTRSLTQLAEAKDEVADVQGQLARVASSRAWKIATRLSRLKTRMAPAGSRRHRAIVAVTDWRTRRRDAGHRHAPSGAPRRSEAATTSDTEV